MCDPEHENSYAKLLQSLAEVLDPDLLADFMDGVCLSLFFVFCLVLCLFFVVFWFGFVWVNCVSPGMRDLVVTFSPQAEYDTTKIVRVDVFIVVYSKQRTNTHLTGRVFGVWSVCSKADACFLSIIVWRSG